ncbi:uncharacterized protein LOC108668005 [Hyalella azteca]|uniref:Carboxylic ester hydrolase n=1 Tax=Hyalella azteca TaxID=294128 RepID=A0A979FN94_HYAAZ|nr:uncharacterized protein LOC108668005 [Hyalella azteca]
MAEMLQLMAEMLQLMAEMLQLMAEMLQLMAEMLQLMAEMLQLMAEMLQLMAEMLQLMDILGSKRFSESGDLSGLGVQRRAASGRQLEPRAIQVRTELGVVTGTLEFSSQPTTPPSYGRRYYSFRGLPYVKAPVGELRWAAPQPLEGGWPGGAVDGRRHKAFCPQYDHDQKKVVGEEDCLFLNVYTPFLPGVNITFGCVYTTAKNTRFKTTSKICIRLGVLGFLSDGTRKLPGNYGALDQVAALKWVQRHISSFGGDARQVTLGGFSAGASFVHLHLLSPLSKDVYLRDDPFLPAPVSELMARPPASPVPVLGGSTRDEGILFALTTILFARNPGSASQVHDEATVYLLGSLWPNITSTHEISHVLHSYYYSPTAKDNLDELLLQMTEVTRLIYLMTHHDPASPSFAFPLGSSLPPWTPLRPGEPLTFYRLSLTPGMVTQPFRHKERNLWQQTLPKLETMSYQLDEAFSWQVATWVLTVLCLLLLLALLVLLIGKILGRRRKQYPAGAATLRSRQPRTSTYGTPGERPE